MNTRAILETGIDDRRTGVDHAVDATYDALNQLLELCPGLEAPVPALHVSAALDEDLLLGVDHDFCDIGVIEYLGKHIETTEAVEDSIAQIELVPEAELRMCEEELVDAVIQLRIAEAPLLLESGEQLLLQLLL